jgi:hypothetical protein
MNKKVFSEKIIPVIAPETFQKRKPVSKISYHLA